MPKIINSYPELGLSNLQIKELKIGENIWKYSVSGNGNKFLLAIMSNVSGLFLALPLAEALNPQYTTIALSVPFIPKFAGVADGLSTILEAEHANICDVIGHSNGTVHLQYLISKYPALVDKIVFSHGLTSMKSEDVSITNASELKLYQTMRKLLKFLPISLIVSAMSGSFIKKLTLQSGKEATKRLRELCKSELGNITKQDLINAAECMEDFLYNYTFSSDDYKDKSEKILIMDSETDTIANPMQRAEMLELCPNSKTYHFGKGGHLTLVNCWEEYISILKGFLL